MMYTVDVDAADDINDDHDDHNIDDHDGGPVGTHYVRVMGRLRGIDPLFQGTGKKYKF